MKSTMMRVDLSINQILDRASQYFGDREVVSKMANKSIHRTNYSTVRVRARQLAKALREKGGIKNGEAVGTLLWNHYMHLECYFGIPAAGAVLHTLNPRLSPEELAYIIDDAEDRVIFVDDVMLPLWEQTRPHLKQHPEVVVVPYAGVPVPAQYFGYEEFINVDASDYEYPVQSEDEPIGMCYTSGTTGRPKGVVYSHRSMILHAITAGGPDFLNLSCRDDVLIVTPMFHANAWSVPFLAAMSGAKQVLPGVHMKPDDLLGLMEDEQTTLALGVPTIWYMVLKLLQADERKWNLKAGMRMLVGGSAVSESLIAQFDELGFQVLQGWGMTETSPLGALSYLKPGLDRLPREKQLAIRASQGMAPPLVDMRIVSDDGSIQPWDGKSIGEVQLRGPWVTGSYHKTASDPSKFAVDGWLRTGDVATIDSLGYMKIVDRSKDIIKSGGEWISSVDLENAILGCAGVEDVAVIAVKHPKWEERPLAVIVRRAGASVTEDDVRKTLEGKVAKWQIPDDYAFVDTLPRTATGKVMKLQLRQQFSDMVSITKQ